MENLLDSIGNMARVSAKAPARQPVNIPPIRLKNAYPQYPRGIGIPNRFTEFPQVTPKIINISNVVRLFSALYFSDSFSNTPSNVMNATNPADVPPPATRQNVQNKKLLVNI